MRQRVSPREHLRRGNATVILIVAAQLLLLKRFDVVWNGKPALRTPHPDEGTWAEPACVIKRAGFDGNHFRCGLQNMIDADAALGAEHTRNLVATVGETHKLLRRTSDCQVVFLDRHGHCEGTPGLALAFFAMAGKQADRFRRYDITH